MKLFDKIKLRLSSIGCYIIADGEDGTITLSEKLFKHILANSGNDDTKVLMFREMPSNKYAFTLSLDKVNKKTYLSNIQYNAKYKCVGFQPVLPTVASIMFSYMLAHDTKAKLKVRIKQSDGTIYYVIEPPKHAKRHYPIS